MHPGEIHLVNGYAASELSGALLLGKFARRASDFLLRSRLTFHSYDEARHAWLWTEFLEKKGARPQSLHGKTDFFEYLYQLNDIVEFLAAVHVYELRVPFHFSLHLRVSSIDSDLKILMQKISNDEKYHLDWVRNYLSGVASHENGKVSRAIVRAGEIEDTIYRGYAQGLKTKEDDEYMQELGSIIINNLESYEYEWRKFVSENKR